MTFISFERCSNIDGPPLNHGFENEKTFFQNILHKKKIRGEGKKSFEKIDGEGKSIYFPFFVQDVGT